MNGLIEGMRRRSREEAAHANQRAKDWTARQVAAERGPIPFVLPPGANAAQAAAWQRAADEIASRERASSKVARGWERIRQTKAPPGCVPVCALFGSKMVILVVDRAGRLCLSEGGKAGAAVTVSEGARIAAGR